MSMRLCAGLVCLCTRMRTCSCVLARVGAFVCAGTCDRRACRCICVQGPSRSDFFVCTSPQEENHGCTAKRPRLTPPQPAVNGTPARQALVRNTGAGCASLGHSTCDHAPRHACMHASLPCKHSPEFMLTCETTSRPAGLLGRRRAA